MPVEHRTSDLVLLETGLEFDGQYASGASQSCLGLARFVKFEATCSGQRGGIHEIGFFLECLVQDPLNRSIAYQFRLPISDVAAVANEDLLEAALGRLRQKTA